MDEKTHLNSDASRPFSKDEMLEARPKILDLTYLVEASDGDTDFIREILGDYLSEMERYVVELNDSLEKKDLSFLIRAAHTMKGASANVGATRVRETAHHLEAQAKKGMFEGSQSLVALLSQEVARVRELLERQGIDDLLPPN